ncbi:MAG: hypothetical protein M9884_13430 [Rhodocyclaceae bacterium]|nr:hypothetical protein [Rhodocyclaceae bacterium]
MRGEIAWEWWACAPRRPGSTVDRGGIFVVSRAWLRPLGLRARLGGRRLRVDQRGYPPARRWRLDSSGAWAPCSIDRYQRVAPAVAITDRLMNTTPYRRGSATIRLLFLFCRSVQIPTTSQPTRWNPRRLLTLGAGVASAGAPVRAGAKIAVVAPKHIIGGSVAVAFVSMLKLASHWFCRGNCLASGIRRHSSASSAASSLAVPLPAVDAGWRPVMGATAAVTALLCAAIWLRVPTTRPRPVMPATTAAPGETARRSGMA